MKLLLRFIAVWLAVFVLVPFLFLAWHLAFIGRVGAVEWITVAKLGVLAALLVGFIGLGTFAIHRLWQLKESGRWAAVASFTIVLGFMLAGTLVRGAGPPSIGAVAYAAWPLAVLLLPSARRACTQQPRHERGARTVEQ